MKSDRALGAKKNGNDLSIVPVEAQIRDEPGSHGAGLEYAALVLAEHNALWCERLLQHR